MHNPQPGTLSDVIEASMRELAKDFAMRMDQYIRENLDPDKPVRELLELAKESPSEPSDP